MSPSSAVPLTAGRPLMASLLLPRCRRAPASGRQPFAPPGHPAPVHAGAAVRPRSTCGSTSPSTGRQDASPARPPTPSSRCCPDLRSLVFHAEGLDVERVRLAGGTERSCRSPLDPAARDPDRRASDRAYGPGGRAGGGDRLLGASPGRALLRGSGRRLPQQAPADLVAGGARPQPPLVPELGLPERPRHDRDGGHRRPPVHGGRQRPARRGRPTGPTAGAPSTGAWSSRTPPTWSRW